VPACAELVGTVATAKIPIAVVAMPRIPRRRACADRRRRVVVVVVIVLACLALKKFASAESIKVNIDVYVLIQEEASDST
jgi:hypothetical protein